MMRKGMLPVIMLPDGDLRIALHLVPFWILTIWESVLICMSPLHLNALFPVHHMCTYTYICATLCIYTRVYVGANAFVNNMCTNVLGSAAQQFTFWLKPWIVQSVCGRTFSLLGTMFMCIHTLMPLLWVLSDWSHCLWRFITWPLISTLNRDVLPRIQISLTVAHGIKHINPVELKPICTHLYMLMWSIACQWTQWSVRFEPILSQVHKAPSETEIRITQWDGLAGTLSFMYGHCCNSFEDRVPVDLICGCTLLHAFICLFVFFTVHSIDSCYIYLIYDNLCDAKLIVFTDNKTAEKLCNGICLI